MACIIVIIGMIVCILSIAVGIRVGMSCIAGMIPRCSYNGR